MTLASLAGAALVLTWSFVTNLTSFYFVQAGLGLVMAAALYEVAFTVVAVWFRRKRARAMLLVTTVAGLASTIFVPLTTTLVHALGWRDALRVLALVLAATAPLHAGVLRRSPRGLGLEPDGAPSPDPSSAPPPPDVRPRDALRAPAFWWLTGAFALDRVSVVAVAAHGVPILGERGYAPGLVAAAVGSIGLMQIAGRLMFVPLAQRAPLRLLCALVFGVHALGLLALLVLPSGAVCGFSRSFSARPTGRAPWRAPRLSATFTARRTTAASAGAWRPRLPSWEPPRRWARGRSTTSGEGTTRCCGGWWVCPRSQDSPSCACGLDRAR